MNTAEAAEYLGITEEELIRSRLRGLPPGNLGFKSGGELTWKKEDLLPPSTLPEPVNTFEFLLDAEEE